MDNQKNKIKTRQIYVNNVSVLFFVAKEERKMQMKKDIVNSISNNNNYNDYIKENNVKYLRMMCHAVYGQ